MNKKEYYSLVNKIAEGEIHLTDAQSHNERITQDVQDRKDYLEELRKAQAEAQQDKLPG